MDKCSYADKYKAMVPPKCNGGNPCKVCQNKWRMMSEEADPEILDKYLHAVQDMYDLMVEYM